jgi:hypothetical protein
MEIEYNVKLYYRIERLEDVLLKLPTLADPIEGALCTIALPNDRCVHVPFTAGRQNLPNRNKTIHYSLSTIH